MPQPKFEGKCDGLKGFIYDCYDGHQTDRYSILMKDITEYVGRDYTYGCEA
jgi:hypothetical protein